MEDKEIVELYWARDDRAISETAEKYGNYLTKIAGNALTDTQDRDECVNDAYLAAWNSMPPHRPRRLGPFLGKLIRRLAIDRYRRLTAAKRGGSEATACIEELAEVLPADNSTEGAVESRELAVALNGFLEGLPARAREIMTRRYWAAEPVAEIARETGMSRQGVKATGVGPTPVSGGGFAPVRRQSPWQYGSIPRGLFLARTQIRSPETASHSTRRNFRAIFRAEEAALLTQGNDDKRKSAEKGPRGAAWVRLPSP